jgi:hypothetical protein
LSSSELGLLHRDRSHAALRRRQQRQRRDKDADTGEEQRSAEPQHGSGDDTPASADAIGHGRIIAESPVAMERLRAERLTSVES